jgi:hypothetical protein
MMQHRSCVLGVIRTTAREDGREGFAETPPDVTTKVVFTPGFATASTAIRWPLTVLRLVVASEVLLQSERLEALVLSAPEH